MDEAVIYILELTFFTSYAHVFSFVLDDNMQHHLHSRDGHVRDNALVAYTSPNGE